MILELYRYRFCNSLQSPIDLGNETIDEEDTSRVFNYLHSPIELGSKLICEPDKERFSNGLYFTKALFEIFLILFDPIFKILMFFILYHSSGISSISFSPS